MSKSKAIGAILGALMLVCVPAAATTVSSDDEVLIRLIGANEMEPLHYSVKAGMVVTLAAQANHGDLLFVFAIGLDQWGEPDYANILPLYFDYPRGGGFTGMIQIPKGLEGRSFFVMALAQGQDGLMRMSNKLTVMVEGALILQGPNPPPARLSRALVLPTDER